MKLSERVEVLEGPDREVNRLIAIAAGGYIEQRGRDGMLAHKDSPNQFGSGWPDYTASIDTAMQLVPDGWDWQMTNTGSGTFGPYSVEMGDAIDQEGKTLAVALTAAALKARGL